MPPFEVRDPERVADLIAYGFAIAVKDVIEVRGLPTRANSEFRAHLPAATADATVVAHLGAAGCVILGKVHTIIRACRQLAILGTLPGHQEARLQDLQQLFRVVRFRLLWGPRQLARSIDQRRIAGLAASSPRRCLLSVPVLFHLLPLSTLLVD